MTGIYLTISRRNIRQAVKLQQRSEEQARRELTQPTVINPSDPRVKSKLFWASGADDGTVSAVAAGLALFPLALAPELHAMRTAKAEAAVHRPFSRASGLIVVSGLCGCFLLGDPAIV